VIDPAITAALADASEAFDILSTVFPVGVVVTIAGLFITIETGILLWHGVNWLIRKIPMIN